MTAAFGPENPTRDVTPRAVIRRVQAVVNCAAGSVGPEAPAILMELLDQFGLDHHVAAPERHEIDAALRAAVDARPDLLIVLAGDGTAGRAAHLCGPDGPLLAPLPGGTMNMLPHALYGAQPWREALIAALERGEERCVSGGEISGRMFYCAAILGSPAFWQPAREAARKGDVLKAWRQALFALRRAFMTRLRFHVAGCEPHKSVAMTLICPLVSRALRNEEGLEAASLDAQDLLQVLRLGLNNLLGDWRRDPSVTSEVAHRGKAWAKSAIPCLVDGEMHWLGRLVDFHFVPKAFRALAPPPQASGQPETGA